MKASSGKIKKRFEQKYQAVDGIITYGKSNLYPQEQRALISFSGTARSCVQLYRKYISGRGFSDLTFYKSVINSGGLTVDKLLRKTADDYASLWGFAIHVTYNGLLQKEEYHWIPFEYCRLVIPDEGGYISKIAVYDNWDGSKGSKNSKKIKFIDVYNPRPDVVEAQINAAGGIEKYTGQVLWVSQTGDMSYPTSPFDPVIKDIETDSSIKDFKNRNVKTNFMASHMFVKKGKFATEKERKDFVEGLEEYQGAEDAFKILLVEVEMDEQTPEIKAMEVQKLDKQYEYTEVSIKDNIIQVFNQPPILQGIQPPGKLGTSSEIADAKAFYDDVTSDERMLFEETFKELFTNYKNPQINPSNDFSIIPITGAKEVDDLSTRLQGIGASVTSLQGILESAVLSRVQKQNALEIIFGLSEEQAIKLTADGQEANISQ